MGNLIVPVRTIIERGRYNCRASLTGKALIIRLPDHLNAGERLKEVGKLIEWAKELYAEKPESFAQFRATELAEQYEIVVRGNRYLIDVGNHDFQHHKIVLVGEKRLQIRLQADDVRVKNGKIIPGLLAKFFAGFYLSEVAERVHALNDKHFRRPINNVKLSDTYTRWGSCSSKGNINLATRLLLAPDEVLDAVIIHELAHLVEANHSHRFWAQVERALPNHKDYDVWLKRHGKELLFVPDAVG